MAENKITDWQDVEIDDWQDVPLDAPIGQPVEESSLDTLKDFGLGAAQGASFGFADEAEALLRSSLGDSKYDEVLADIRNRYSESEARSPYASFAGNIVGGVALPGIGAAKSGLKAGELIAHGLKAGAAMGALTGLGQTEKSLIDDTSGTLADTAEGALAGAAFGAIIPAAGKALDLGTDIASSTKFVKDLKESVKHGLAGNKLAGTGVKDTKFASFSDEVQKFVDELGTARSKSQEDYSALYGAVDKRLAKLGKQPKSAREYLEAAEELINSGNNVDKKAGEIIKSAIGSKTGLKTLTSEVNFPVGVKNAPEAVIEKARSAAQAQLAKGRLDVYKQLTDAAEKMKSGELDPAEAKAMRAWINSVDEGFGDMDQAVQKIVEPGGSEGFVGTFKKPEVISKENPIANTVSRSVEKGVNVAVPLADAAPEVISKSIKSSIDLLDDPLLTPNKAQKLKSELQQLLSNQDIQSSPTARQALEGLIDDVNNQRAGNFPAAKEILKDLDKQYKDQTTLGKFIGTGKDSIIELEDPLKQFKMNERLDRLLYGATEEGTTHEAFLTWKKHAMPYLESVYGPEKANQMLKSLEDKSMQLRLSKQMVGEQGLTSEAANLFVAARGVPLVGAHAGALAAGEVKRQVSSAGKSLATLTNKMVTRLGQNPEELSRVANKVGGSVGRMMHYIAGQPEARRRTLMFAAVQQPAFREALAPEMGSDDEF